MAPDVPQEVIDRVARRLAYDEFPDSSGPDRQAFAARCWRQYVFRARNALEAAFLADETLMTSWEWSALRVDAA